MSKTQKTLGIIGGGLAGIAAAEAATKKGYRTVLFERAGSLGGRVTSIFEPEKKQWIDTGQHIILGCCTEVIALNQRLKLDHFFERFNSIPFAAQRQKHWNLSATSLLPKRWQLLPAFLRMPSLSFAERIKTGRQLYNLCSGTLPEITMADWLKQHHVSDSAIDTFWLPLILSSLSDVPDCVSVRAVKKVIQHSFLAGQECMAVYLPAVPLRTIYHKAAAEKLVENNVSVHCFKRLHRLHWERKNSAALPTITASEFSDGTIGQFDRYILAIPAFQLWKVLEASQLPSCIDQLGLNRFEPGAITTVHLWLDQPVLAAENRYCILSGGIGQFLSRPANDLSYYTAVISASHRLLSESEMSAAGSRMLAFRILEQLRETFDLPKLQIKHCRTTTCFDAVFSPKPEVYDSRPASCGLFENARLAGDWTQTGFPATLEGAVRSGLTAVDFEQE